MFLNDYANLGVLSGWQCHILDFIYFALYHNRVELWREPGKSLGISIVGGRGMGSRLSSGEVMRGIFIKHILEDSPAGKNGTLKTGDRIVEVPIKCLSVVLASQESLK